MDMTISKAHIYQIAATHLTNDPESDIQKILAGEKKNNKTSTTKKTGSPKEEKTPPQPVYEEFRLDWDHKDIKHLCFHAQAYYYQRISCSPFASILNELKQEKEKDIDPAIRSLDFLVFLYRELKYARSLDAVEYNGNLYHRILRSHGSKKRNPFTNRTSCLKPNRKRSYSLPIPLPSQMKSHAKEQWYKPAQSKLDKTIAHNWKLYQKAVLISAHLPQRTSRKRSLSWTPLPSHLEGESKWMPPSKDTKPKKTQWEMFALSFNKSYEIVKPFSDHSFPLRVVSRTCIPHLMFKDTRSVIGKSLHSQKSFLNPYKLRGNELKSMTEIVQQFTCRFKASCSFYSLLSLKKKPVFNPEHTVEVSVRGARLQFKKALTLRQYEVILAHLSRINRGVTTLTEAQQIEKNDPTWTYLIAVRPVPDETKKQLNIELKTRIWTFFQQPSDSSSLYFAHRYYNDFDHSHQFFLRRKRGRKDIQRWSSRPSFSEVVHALGNPSNFSQQKTFSSHLDSLQFHYARQGTTSFPLMEFFQGELKLETGKHTHFRIDGKWYELQGQHLARLQRDFYEVIRESLLTPAETGHLPLPWIKNKRWIAFSLKEASISTDQTKKVVRLAIETLSKSQYRFIDEQGNVLYPYVTLRLLEAAESVMGLTRLLMSKRQAQLSELLKKNQDEGKPVSDKELKTVFPKKVKEVKPLLIQNYPLIEEIKSTRTTKTITILDEQGIPLHSDLSDLSFKTDLIDKRKTELGQMLEDHQSSQTPLSQDTLQTLKSIGPKKSQTIINCFKEEQTVKEISKRYLITGPVPKNPGADDKTQAFLDSQHTEYLKITLEEGYNRFYLEEESYLVFDQIYADSSHKQKLELFDILYYSKCGKTFLYHVKAGFTGGAVRAACSQIQSAAENLSAVLRSEDDFLSRFHQAAIRKEKNESPFRRKAREKLKKLQVDGKTGEPAFHSLFNHEDKRQIIFIYAFVDDSDSDKEKFLLEEPDPSYQFSEQDFAGLGDKGRLGQLRKAKLLDSYNRLSSQFFSLPDNQIKQKIKSCFPSTNEAIFRILNEKNPHFHSFTAKLSLWKTKRFVEGKGFSFKICQIQRGQRTPENRIGSAKRPFSSLLENSSFGNSDPRSDSWEVDSLSDTETTVVPEDGLSRQLGISNVSGTDCFFSSTMQLIMHSNLIEHVLKKEKLLLPDPKEPAAAQQNPAKLCQGMETFYQEWGQSKDRKVNHLRQFLRGLELGQQDAAQALRMIMSFYDWTNSDMTVSRKIVKKANITDQNDRKKIADDITNDKSTGFSSDTIQGNTYCFTEVTPEVLIPIESPNLNNIEDDLTFQILVDTCLKEKTCGDADNEWRIRDLVPVTNWTEQTSLENLGNHLFFELPRFSPLNGQQIRVGKAYDFAHGRLNLSGQSYDLRGFIFHKGSTLHSGHYIAFCKTDNGWQKFDDRNVVGGISDTEALQCASLGGDTNDNGAYIVYFRKIDNG